VLDALGIREPLREREWIPEVELQSITRDRREIARVLNRLARMDGVLVHVRNTKKGRYWFLEKAITSSVTSNGKGMGAAAHSRPPRQGFVSVPPADLSLEDEEESLHHEPATPGKASTRSGRHALAADPGRRGPASPSSEDGQAAALHRAIEDIGVRVDHVEPEPLVTPTVTQYRVYLAPGESRSR
jgi:hypothetical protein